MKCLQTLVISDPKKIKAKRKTQSTQFNPEVSVIYFLN